MNVDNLADSAVFAGYLFYAVFDVFSVMYFANEIKLKSEELFYNLYQSSWIEQTLKCKKILIIFGERLKQPHVLVVLKMYPLTLETFNKILNSAYNMFKILQNLKW
ncbi:Odorant receptor Or2 [Pseudolycoriella hygida]|uniref:Odorant receptor Or2 n=1 Tax=Pseudolycoriella hygida TaxID=35572 RepID=A0A9Q0MR66_9DIPT|nr:Odorant receptor Or2 [Pseudolycoriella hygida]